MPDCRYCDAIFEEDEELADHLVTAHEWAKLSRIDRKRIEVLRPEDMPEAEKEPRLIETANLDTLLEQEPTTKGLVQALAEHERLVRQAERYDERSYAKDMVVKYYEPLATHLDAVVRAKGWPVLADLMDAYDPEGDADDSPATPVIGNAIGRYLIQTRLDEGVAALPEDGLDYLFALRGDEAGRGWDEAAACGWGIGHPSYPVADRLHTVARTDVRWVTAALDHAFYADQHAACDCLVRIARDDEISNKRFLLSCVHGQHRPKFEPGVPRFRDWDEDVVVNFEWDETVVGRIEDLVAEVGIEENLPDDWSLSDLAV